ncbi:hypothetical protein GBA52_020606 [Prunus armeniaca]|nr:hypothetical protein GBA52_020606 [Prunus armeniaca]
MELNNLNLNSCHHLPFVFSISFLFNLSPFSSFLFATSSPNQPCPLIHHLHLSLLPTASPNKPSNSTMRPPSNSGVPTLNFLKPPSKPTKFRERKREKTHVQLGGEIAKKERRKKEE